MAKSKTATKAAPDTLTIPVQYGDVSVGDQIARVGVSIDRKRLSLPQADKLCGKRLIGRITYTAGNDNPDQEAIPGLDAVTEMEGAFDVKRFGFGPKSMTTGLSFAISSIDLPTLCAFAKRSGTVVIDEVTSIPEDEQGDE